SKNGELEIGSVPTVKYDRFKQLLATNPITKDKSLKWNCQDWSLRVLRELREEGFIEEQYSNDVVKY
ncbi:hypothetical protein BCR34DRAFT_530087, partial [Clohesyomyces aquaticus]